ncbi:MAG: hypothetical protein ACLGGO_33355 [Coleofasciculus sp.]
MPAAIPEVNRQTAMELGKIGVNLNQQIRAMNTAIARLSDYHQCRGSALLGGGSFEVSQTAPRRAARRNGAVALTPNTLRQTPADMVGVCRYCSDF